MLEPDSTEIALAKAALKDKSIEELELYLSLMGSVDDDWTFGKALHMAAKQIILEKMDKVLLEDK